MYAIRSYYELTTENISKQPRLHPRCGTAFIVIVFVISIFVYPFINIFYNTQEWYNHLSSFAKLGNIIQMLIHVLTQIFVGLPIVSSISYEILKISGKNANNPLVKFFISPGLLFQLFTTREPDEEMIKAAVISLKMVLGEEA